MPAVKISALPAAGTLSGTEELPVVQGGVTARVSVNAIRSGSSVPAHSHTPADVSTLTTTLAGKADIGHSHTPADVSTLTTTLAGKADTGHSHTPADVSTLQATLDACLRIGRHTVWIPAGAMISRSTAGAAAGSSETTTHKVMRRTLDFDATAIEYAQFSIAMPKAWNCGTVNFQALWQASGGSGGVVFALQGLALSDGEALDNAFGTAVTVTDTLSAANVLHLSSESPAVTLAGSPAAGDLILFQIFRDPTHAADTLAQDAALLGVRLFYTSHLRSDD